MRVEWSFPARPEAVTTARQLVLEALPGLPRGTTEALALMVSELATNCVVHARTNFQVRVFLNDHVRVEVTDSGPGEAEVRRPRAGQAHGRGLQTVDALADEWGVEPSRVHSGKTVWFTVTAR
ncbi:MAG TPA: ATP-binding protein [Jatrophihabitantaceae bacterium]|nr:ATP-binding protein [Jatrophihabitantaceae bacterium]